MDTFHDVVRRCSTTTAKRSACGQCFDLHHPRKSDCGESSIYLINCLKLGGERELDATPIHLHDAIHRLHGRMRQIREVECGRKTFTMERRRGITCYLECFSCDIGDSLTDPMEVLPQLLEERVSALLPFQATESASRPLRADHVS